MTDKLTKPLRVGRHPTTKVALRASEAKQKLLVGVPMGRKQIGVGFEYQDVAELLGRDALDEMKAALDRKERFSGVNSLHEVGGEAPADRSLDAYHNAEESGSFAPSDSPRRKETVEVQVQDLIQLRHAARGAPSGKRLSNALTRTARLLNE